MSKIIASYIPVKISINYYLKLHSFGIVILINDIIIYLIMYSDLLSRYTFTASTFVSSSAVMLESSLTALVRRITLFEIKLNPAIVWPQNYDSQIFFLTEL